MSVWTPAELERLGELHASGASRRHIASILGMSLGAVIGKLGREYRAGRLVPPTKASSDSYRNIRRRELARLAPSAASSAPRQHYRARYTLPGPIAAPRSCQWPLWAHNDRAPRPPIFCNAALDVGSYCRQHHRLAH
jgi:hypothetical protein